MEIEDLLIGGEVWGNIAPIDLSKIPGAQSPGMSKYLGRSSAGEQCFYENLGILKLSVCQVGG
jgi:hypothetical protein